MNRLLAGTRSFARRPAVRVGMATAAATFLGTLAPRPAAAQRATDELIEPRAGTWRPWLLRSGSQFRPAPPPDQATGDAELRELRAIATRRDAATQDRIKYWDAGSAAYRWTELLIEWSQVRNQVALPRPFALVTASLADALIAAWDAKYAYHRPRPTELDPSLPAAVAVPRSPSYPSEHAAAAGAASVVLTYLFPNDAGVFAALAEEAARSRVEAGVQFPSDAAAGLELGRRVGALAVERAQSDSANATWSGEIPTGPGLWTGANPGGVTDRFWRPWLLESPEQVPVPPPPAHGSEAHAAELAAVRDFPRTPRTTALALNWQYGFYGGSVGPVYWVREASRRLFEERLDANAPWAARLYAALCVGQYDAWIVAQHAKFTYWAARPFQLDPSIQTVFPTPNHPSYPSNRSIQSLQAEVLAHFFPREAESFRQTAAQIAESALWAGIHFPSDLAAGSDIGRHVGRAVLDRIATDA